MQRGRIFLQYYGVWSSVTPCEHPWSKSSPGVIWSDTRRQFIIPSPRYSWTSFLVLTSCLFPQQDNPILSNITPILKYPGNEKSRTIPSISPLPSMPMLFELSTCQVFAKKAICFPRIFKAHGRQRSQWMFQTICRRCEENNIAPNYQSTCGRNGNFISIDQVVEGLSTECALVALRDDLRYFFWTSELPQDL